MVNILCEYDILEDGFLHKPPLFIKFFRFIYFIILKSGLLYKFTYASAHD
jgi:hypothetical protein